MNICVVAYKFGNEKEIGEHLGTYHYFIEKMRTLVKDGHEVIVVAPYLSFIRKGSENIDGVKVIRYFPPMMNTIWLFPVNRIIRRMYILKTQRVVLKTLKTQKIDLVYVWQARETGYAIAKIKEKIGVPFFFRQITAWHWHFERSVGEIFGKKPWYKKLQKIGLGRIIDKVLAVLLDKESQILFAKTIYDKADKVVFLSRAAIDESKELSLDPKKAVDLGVAIEEDFFRPMNNKDSIRKELGIKGDHVVLFIGRLSFAEKGIGYLIEAMKEVVSHFSSANLIIVGGGGEEDRARKLIGELALEKNIQIVGKKPFQDLPKYINAADVLVVPSVWMEAFGQVTIEGMSCGVPVITSDAGASPEINIDGETGIVVPAKDIKKLTHAIIEILSNDNERLRMGGAARQRVLSHYTYSAITKKFLGIIKQH